MTADFDAIIIGGAYSGAAVALLLKRARPTTRVLIVEGRTAFDRKVGESTSDVAGCFLTRVLRQHSYLVREHLPKQGLRFWFTTPENDDLARCGEMGSHFQVRLPTFQVDRSTLDEHLLDQAREAGCEIWRPAKVKTIDLGGLGRNTLDIERDGQLITLRTAWVIDASGKAAMLGRKHDSLKVLDEHPTRSMWVRFRGVKDLDGEEIGRQLGPKVRDALPCSRMMATNHLSGRGWWCWLIPLKNGDLSAGLTWDTRMFTPPEGPSIGDRLKQHLCTHPVGRALFSEAEPIAQDARAYSQLAYVNTQVAGDGWACIGDAAGFMDPLYSQGLDFCSHTAYVVHGIVLKSLDGATVSKEIKSYAKEYQKSYRRWFRALYLDKYEYLGDFELMWPAFLLDLSTYFIGPVRLVYDHTEEEFSRLPYFGAGGAFFAWWMSVYNRRLAAIARKRVAAGVYGRHNLDRRRFLRSGFSPDSNVLRPLRQGLRAWLMLEFHSLFLKTPPAPPVPAGAAAEAAPPLENPVLHPAESA